MGLWSKLFWWRGSSRADEQVREHEQAEPGATGETGNTVDLPREPFVFECQSCGKVFEARRRRPQCPECDSTDVSILSG
jgi:Zn finger protein HypA/HybF involved in hydrogenase expression